MIILLMSLYTFVIPDSIFSPEKVVHIPPPGIKYAKTARNTIEISAGYYPFFLLQSKDIHLSIRQLNYGNENRFEDALSLKANNSFLYAGLNQYGEFNSDKSLSVTTDTVTLFMRTGHLILSGDILTKGFYYNAKSAGTEPTRRLVSAVPFIAFTHLSDGGILTYIEGSGDKWISGGIGIVDSRKIVSLGIDRNLYPQILIKKLLFYDMYIVLKTESKIHNDPYLEIESMEADTNYTKNNREKNISLRIEKSGLGASYEKNWSNEYLEEKIALFYRGKYANAEAVKFLAMPANKRNYMNADFTIPIKRLSIIGRSEIYTRDYYFKNGFYRLGVGLEAKIKNHISAMVSVEQSSDYGYNQKSGTLIRRMRIGLKKEF